jgi:bifunctional DNase/RNase
MSLVQMTVLGVGVDPLSDSPVVILRSLEGDRVLPVSIGESEAIAIGMALEGQVPPRPLTHDLMRSLLEGLKARFLKTVICRLENDVFYAEIHLMLEERYFTVDSRPSDAIALALRFQADIFVEEGLLSRAIKIRPDQDSAESIAQRLKKIKPEDFGKLKL